MTPKSNRGILLIFIIIVCFNVFSNSYVKGSGIVSLNDVNYGELFASGTKQINSTYLLADNTDNNTSVPDQQKRVAGRITDSKGASLPGVNIVEKSTTNGVLSDANGNYSLNVSSGNAVLVFSFIGFTDQEILVGSQNSINVTLAESTLTLVSKDVQIAYGAQPTWMVTSAISSVTGSQLQKSFTPYLNESLSGRLPGLTQMEGSDLSYIRGLNTYGTGRSILIIVDGIESAFKQLTPDEIESVSVLKDASALALYGSRGANGVLLITTKRGKEGPIKVSFSTQQGFVNQSQDLPAQFLGSYDYARLYNEAQLNDDPERTTLRYSDTDLEAYQTGSDPVFYPDVNWYNELYRKTARATNYNLNFTGGNQGVQYFVAVNYLNRDGLLKKTAEKSDNSIDQKDSRLNFRANVDLNLSDRWSAVFLLGGSIKNTATPDFKPTLYTSIPPNAFPVRNPDGFSWGGSSLYSNPVGDIYENGFFETNSSSIQTSFKLSHKLDYFIPGLNASALISFNNFYTGYSNKTRTYARYSLTKDALGNTVYNKISQPTSLVSAEGMNENWRNMALQAFLTYNGTFGTHRIDAMMMMNDEVYSVAQTALPFKYLGVGGRFTYVNHEKYIGEISFAYNGSENFPKGNRWGLFPAVSLGWIASGEEFLKGSNVINYLKIRGSYGLTGNDNIGGKRFMFNPSAYDGFFGSSILGTSNSSVGGYAQGMASNINVTWEKEKKMNIGLEATILRNFDVALDIFKNDRYDILAKPTRTIPDYLGFILPDYNLGKTNNKGFEAMIRYNSDQTKDLKFFVETNVWYARNKIVYNAEPFQAETYLYKTGKQIDQPFLLEATGFFNSDAEISASPKLIFSPSRPKLGDIRYNNQNSDDIIDQKDYAAIGKSPIPELTVGFETGFEFKGFDVNVFIQGVTGSSVYLNGPYYYAFQNNAKISDVALGRWTTETASTATYPRLSAVNNLNNYQQSSFWQRDGSFIKLRSVELGYSIPDAVTRKVLVSTARVFVNGTNLLSLEHLDFAKPESLSVLPRARTYSIGVRVQF